jgi:DNA repair protein RecO (recombination protein O)
MILTTEALVLRTMKYSESSLIATLFTRDHGKISLLAKGARRKTRPFGASVEVMNHVCAVIYHKSQRELQLLTQCDLVKRYPVLVEDLPCMGIGMTAVELLHLSTEHDEPHPEVFDLTVNLFQTLQSATQRYKNALYAYEVRLLGLLGFKPSLRQCVSCKEDLSSFRTAMPQGRLRVTGNGVLCERCGERSDAGVVISSAACAALESFQNIEGIEASLRVVVTKEMSRDIEETLRHLVQVHLTGMRPLMAEQVFSRIQ